VDARWTDVARFPSRSTAGFVAAVLEDAGIRTRVVSDDGGGVLPHLDALTGGVHVEVPGRELEAARELLAGLETGPASDLAEPLGSRLTWRAVGIVLLALVMALTVGGVFLP
jgi:hypothetical protein